MKSGLTNVEFLKGEMEHIPLPDNSVDVILSNCVINLSADKDRVIAEAFRVLKPGGRLAVSDVVVRGGDVPAEMEKLTKLPGVGRKTANVVLGHALGVPGLPVDRHVLRVSNRIGIAEGDDPVKVEAQLCAALPPGMWTLASDVLILHGRRICRPKPLCDKCLVIDDCNYYRSLTAAPERRVKAARPARRTLSSDDTRRLRTSRH